MQGVLTRTHTLTLNEMNEANLSSKGELSGEHSWLVYMKCLVATPLHHMIFLR